MLEEARTSRKAAEIVADAIRGEIVRGELTEGDILPAEAHLIARFGVSRPTLREAVRILESEQLVRVARGARGGAVVNQPSIDFISRAIGYSLQARKTTLGDVYAARCAIEPPAARIAAETRPDEAAAVLAKHVEMEFTIIDDRSRVAAAVATFHRLLVQESGNKTMGLLVNALYSISERHMSLVHQKNDPVEDLESQVKRTHMGVRSHDKLVKLIAAGAGRDAEAHWAEHLAKASDYWLRGFGDAGLDILE